MNMKVKKLSLLLVVTILISFVTPTFAQAIELDNEGTGQSNIQAIEI
mgnify:FL=1